MPDSPTRLIVKADCVTVHGIVGCIKTFEDDGDTQIGPLLDKGQKSILHSASLSATR